MRQFIAFVKKEFYHIFRDRRTMLILLGMPVVQIVLFGFAISTEVKNVRLAVLDPSNDVVTRKIIDRLDASEYFTVTARFHSPQEMEAAFLKNKVDMAIVFSERFIDDLYTGDARVQLVVDATDPNMSTSQVNYATGIVSMVGQEMMPPNMSAARLTSDIKLLYNPQMKSAYNFVPGVMGLILMLICAMMTSISIVREKETGTMEVLLVSPVKPLFIILAKAVPYFVLSFVNLITILLLSVFVLDVPVVGSLFWLITVSLLFIFVSLALGLLISSVTRTQVAAMLVSGLMLMMPTMLLSGMIFPIESIPLILQWISDILPARWYIQAVRKLMIDVQLVVDATDPNMSTSQVNYATGIVSMVGQEMMPPNMSAARLTSDIKLLYNPQMKSAYNFVPGVMGLILMLICAMMTSISIVREKETGTMEVLLVSPVKPLFIILAKAVPYFVLSFVNLITILLLSVFVLDVPVVGSLFWLITVSLLFIFVSLALGLLISSVTRTQVAAMLVSGLMLMMPTMLLSGMIFPIESIPLILQWISDILPARWYIQAVRKLMIEGVPVVLVYKEIGILLLMATVLITISIKKFKYRLE